MAKVKRLNDPIGFWGISTEEIERFLEEANGEDIEIRLSSPGGDLFEALTIYDAIKEYEGHTTCYLVGFVASAASYIATAFDEVVANEASIFLIHNSSVEVDGTIEKLKKTIEDLEHINSIIVDRMSAFSGKSKEEVKSALDAETTYYGKGILENGFATKYEESGEKPLDKESVAAETKLRLDLFKKRVAAFSYKKKTVNVKEEMEDMTKDLEKQIREALANKTLSFKDLVEISDSKYFAITDKEKKILDSVKDLDIENLKKRAKKADDLERDLKITAEFGAKSEDNFLRQAVEDFVNAGFTDIEKIKEMPTIKALAKKKADIKVNVIESKTEKNDDTDTESMVQEY